MEPVVDLATRRSAIAVMLCEHRRLSSIISAMLRMVDETASPGAPPRAMLMRAMLYYIHEFPEQIHHPKEEQYLFARLCERTDEFDAVIDELRRQHEEGKSRLIELERALTNYELAGVSMLPALRDEVYGYADFYARHRHLEESVILPAAQHFLTLADWVEIDEAFGANRDPFDRLEVEDNLDDLYALIVQTMPDTRS
jgi:hemerythrin-like domain-containing protein